MHEAIVAAYPAVFRYAYVLTGDQAQAEDICQEAVVKTLWRARRAAFTNVEAYLIRVALNDFLQSATGSGPERPSARPPSSSPRSGTTPIPPMSFPLWTY